MEKKGLWAGAPSGGWPERDLGWVYHPVLQNPALVSPDSTPYPVRQSVSAILPTCTDSPAQAKGLSGKRSPPTRPGLGIKGTLTMLSTGKAIAGIIPGNRHWLPAHLSVNVELLGQRVDHHRQVLLPHLGHRKMAYHTGPRQPYPPALHWHLWGTHQDEVCLVSGQHQHGHVMLSQRRND